MAADLTGSVAFITGASGGLGAHFARLLARQGAAVAITARRVDKIESLAEEIRAGGGKAIALPLDVADAPAIGPALDRAAEALGPITILINNAGVGGEGLALELSIEDFDAAFDVNVRGTFFAAREAAKRMLTRSLAREWARRGLAVNALCPGYIETAINDAWWPTEGGQRQLKGFPRRRLMDAEDLDEAFLMLAGPAARAITGSVITIDDGQSLPGGG